MFKFELNQKIAIATSYEVGTVIGRAEYVHGDRGYLTRYRAADGRAVEAWWTESALVAFDAPDVEVSAAEVSARTLAMVEGAAKAPDPTAGGDVDRTVAAPIQNVGDGTD